MNTPTTERLREIRGLYYRDKYRPWSQSIVALIDAEIARRDAVPVAWMHEYDVIGPATEHDEFPIESTHVGVITDRAQAESMIAKGHVFTPLYSAPPIPDTLRDRCEALVRKWRIYSEDRMIDRICREMYDECAEELAALGDSDGK